MPRFELHVAPIPDRRGVNPFTKEPIVIAGRPGVLRFWEAELVGSTLHQCSGDGSGRVERSEQTFPDEDQARLALGSLIAKRRRAGFVEAGPSRELEQFVPRHTMGSAILVDEYFASGDERFLDELIRTASAAKLANLADRWYGDPRPFARKMLLAYIDDGCDRPEHKALVKRLFKLAEKSGDDEAMGRFMVAFDRLAGRILTRIGARWIAARREVEDIIGLRGDPSVPERLEKDRNGKHKASARFSRTTRRYLARRAFRYFRRLGRRDVARYGAAMRAALPVYRDEMLSTPARLLDAWGMMHALYGYSPVLVKAPRGLRVKEGQSLSELQPLPYFAAAWKGVFEEILTMTLAAQSRPVRTWALAVLREQYANELRALPFARIKALLASAHEEVLRLGAELLTTASGLETLLVDEWLDLLRIEQIDVLGLVCDSIKKHVTPARLTLAQCVELACAQAAPVATLGLEWAKSKPIRSAAELETVLRIAKAGVQVVRAEGARWIGSLLKELPFATAEHARDLCDARFADARAEGLACLESDRYKGELSLWFALTESPYDDVRGFVVRHAGAWRDEAAPATLSHVWSSALLAVHRGGVAKRRVPREIADRIVGHPEEAAKLLPILGVALRSVRPTERASALASLARAVARNDALRGMVHEHLPELTFSGRVTA